MCQKFGFPCVCRTWNRQINFPFTYRELRMKDGEPNVNLQLLLPSFPLVWFPYIFSCNVWLLIGQTLVTSQRCLFPDQGLNSIAYCGFSVWFGGGYRNQHVCASFFTLLHPFYPQICYLLSSSLSLLLITTILADYCCMTAGYHHSSRSFKLFPKSGRMIWLSGSGSMTRAFKSE